MRWPNQTLQPTGHARHGSSRYEGFSRVSRLLNHSRGGAATPREGTGKTAEGGPKEVGAPACGIAVASGATALTPRYEDLDAGTWARDPSLRRHLYYILSEPWVAVADLSLVFSTRC